MSSGTHSMSRIVSDLATIENIANELLKTHSGTNYPNGIRTESREADITLYRHLFFFIASDAGWTLASIGKYLGGFNHATIHHANNKIENCIEMRETRTLTAHSEFMTRLKAMNKANLLTEGPTPPIS